MDSFQTVFGEITTCTFGSLLAYIDPSTGSLIFQVLAASLISAGLFVRGLRERVAWLMTGGWRAKKTIADEAVSTDEDIAVAGQITPNQSARKAA